jgi:uncharacterized protein
MPIRTAEKASAVMRDDLSRMIDLEIRMADGENGDGLTIEGLATPFNVRTVIRSWEGTFEEQFRNGAFKRTLNAGKVKMQFDHGQHPLVGSIPIGAFSSGYPKESDAGLEIMGRLNDNWLIEPVRDAIKSKGIDGMSIRFSVVREEWTTATGVPITDMDVVYNLIWKVPEEGMLIRTITEAKLFEAGPVVFPAYETTTVGVRSLDLTDLSAPATRSALARAVLLADRASMVDTADDSTTDDSLSTRTSPATTPQVDSTDNRPGLHSSQTRARRMAERAEWFVRNSVRP